MTSRIPARDRIYLEGLRKNSIDIIDIADDAKGIKKLWRLYQKHRQLNGNYDLLWVGYTAHLLVPFARFISRKKIVFNALASLYEGTIISRGQASRYSFQAISHWLIDVIAFFCADYILVESDAQREFLSKTFLVPKRKLIRTWTGTEEAAYFYDSSIQKLPVFTAVFRGNFIPEAGVEYAVLAMAELKDTDIRLRILGNGMMAPMVTKLIEQYGLSNNIEWIKQRLSEAELRQKMQECHLSLGHLSNHERLERTIPYKAFESLAMKLPYVTARNPAVMELLKEDETCFFIAPASAKDLAQKIRSLKEDSMLRERVAEQGFSYYKERLRSEILAKDLLAIIYH